MSIYLRLSFYSLFFALIALCGFIISAKPASAQISYPGPTIIRSVNATFSGNMVVLEATGYRGCDAPCATFDDTYEVKIGGWLEDASPRRMYIPYNDSRMLGTANEAKPDPWNGDNNNGSARFYQYSPYEWTYRRVLPENTFQPGFEYRFCINAEAEAGTDTYLPPVPAENCGTFTAPGSSVGAMEVCGQAEKILTQTIGGGNTVNGGLVTVKFKVSNAKIENNKLSFHYDIYVDRQTPAFTNAFTVHQGRTPTNPGTLVITEPVKQTSVPSHNITTAIIQGDASGPVNNFNTKFSINWRWTFAFTYNTHVGPQTSSLPGGALVEIEACPDGAQPVGDYSLAGSLPQVKYRGETAVFTIRVQNCSGGFNGPVNNLRVTSGLPAGSGSVSFYPSDIASCDPTNNTALMVVPIPAGTELGTFVIYVSGTGLPGVRTTTVNLTVLRAPVVSVSIEPKDAKVLSGSTLSYSLIATLQDGTTEDVTPHANFTSAQPLTALIAGNTALGIAVGTTQITGTYLSGAVSDTTPLNVVDFKLVCPGPQSFYEGSVKGVLYYLVAQNGFDGDVVYSAQGAGLTINPNAGSMTAPAYTQVIGVSGSAGSRTLTYTVTYAGPYGAKTDSCAVPVTILPQLSGITIAPPSATIPVGSFQDYTVTAHYTDGTSRDVTFASSYTSANTSIATVVNRRATGVSAGTTGIKAVYTENGITKEDTAQLTVTPTTPANPNPPTVSINNGVCGQIIINWLPASSGPAPAGFRVYRSQSGPPTYNWTQLGSDLPASARTITDTSPLNSIGLNYYAVTAFNASGESGKALTPGAAVLSCGPDFSRSDKDLIQVGLSANTTVPCNGFDPVTVSSSIRPGTAVSFAVNICNTGPAATQDVLPADIITVRDQLLNITNITSLTCTKSDGSACSLSNIVYTGSAPSQRVTFNVSHPGGLKIGEHFSVRFAGVLPQVPPNRSLYRFRNSADIYLNNSFKKRVDTPYFSFINGSFVPEKIEIAP